ncbi:MAG TPA: DUF5666 domain-containing protein [Burkholderiaceae bacterium]|nr:DUF5666 domain-containing protein [Burkholderiaceae bacterium]
MRTIPFFSGRLARNALAWLAAAVLAIGCGGGGGGGGDDSAGSALTIGTITGFGSIIVDGVRFDDSGAQVVDDDDTPHASNDLRLGMTVEVLSDRVQTNSSGRRAHARHIRFGAEIVGPVEAIDPAARQLTVLGQTVEVTDTTVFDDSLAGGLPALALGDLVEVHAQFNAANGHYIAKRIEKEDRVNFFRLRGLVSNLDATAKTFDIGGATISYAAIASADLPPNFADGARVRVRLQTVAIAGVWQAVTIRSGVRKVEDHAEAEVRGIVTAFTDLTSFSVNGLPVTTGAGTAFSDGTAGIVLGAEVEVEGAIVDGVLVASEVELEDHHRGDDDRLNELHGTVGALDTTAQTFVVRGVRVHYSAGTTFDDGSVSDLADGKQVEVKGRLATDGVTLEAVKVDFE